MQISLMRKLMHNNIVDYIGIGCTDKSSEASRRATMFLVSELLEGGTLKRLCMDQMMTPHRWVRWSAGHWSAGNRLTGGAPQTRP